MVGVGLVFSAHAEVVPYSLILWDDEEGILRARGGSSHQGGGFFVIGGYSPRTRR